MAKMTATVQVEFELLEGQATDIANTALIGGVGALKLAIERGVTGTGQTGVKPGTSRQRLPNGRSLDRRDRPYRSGRSPDWIKG